MKRLVNFCLLCLAFTNYAGASEQDWNYRNVPKLTKTLEVVDSVYFFKLHPWMPSINKGQRSELRDHNLYYNGNTVNFEIWTKLATAPGFSTPEVLTVSQWHEGLKKGSKRPPYAHRIRGNKFQITIWNDQEFKRSGGVGSGILFAEFEMKVGYWYHFEGRLKFDPVNGFVSVKVQECKTVLDCTEFRTFTNENIGIGYSDALNYYFKFGVYTVYPFSRKTDVLHFMKPEWIY